MLTSRVLSVFYIYIPAFCWADIDLTHTLGEGLDQGWKGSKDAPNSSYKRTILNNGSWAGIVPYAYYAEFSTPEHSGTHTDSPSSFCKGQWHIHQIPLDNLFGPGVIIDISEKAEKNKGDAYLTVMDITKWEKEHGRIPKGAVVIMNSGWYRKYADDLGYYGWNKTTEYNMSLAHFPGWSEEAIEFLATERDIVGIAVDTIELDPGKELGTFKAHLAACRHNIWGIENIANLDKLPPKGFILYNMVMKIELGSAAPGRVFASIPGQEGSLHQEFHADYCKKYHADHPITQHYDQTHPIANAHSPSDRSEGSGVKGLYGSVILVLATFSVKIFIGYF